MATITQTWAFATTSSGWTGVPVGTGNATTYQSGLGNPAGSLGNITTGHSGNGTGYWYISGTWAALFGIPTGAVVTNILVSGDHYDGKCNTYTVGASSTDGPLELRSSAGGSVLLTLVAGRTYTAIDSSWVTRSPGSLNQAIAAGQQAATTNVTLQLNGAVKTGSTASPNNTLLQDNVTITITYNVPASVTLTGASATSAPGAVTKSGAAVVALVGAAITLAAGIVIATASSPASVNLTGARCTTAAGTVIGSGDSSVLLDGAAVTALPGAVTAVGSQAETAVTTVGASIGGGFSGEAASVYFE